MTTKLAVEAAGSYQMALDSHAYAARPPSFTPATSTLPPLATVVLLATQ